MSESGSRVDRRDTERQNEGIAFFRPPEILGVEMRAIENSSRLWRCFSSGFEFLAPDGWHGDVVARNRRERLVRGRLFCAHPGEVYSTPRVHAPGALNALVIEPELLAELLAERGSGVGRLDLRRVVDMSTTLQENLAGVFQGFRSGATAAEHRARLREFIGVLVSESIERELESKRPACSGVSVSPAERVREYLELDPSARTDLRALSDRTGLSRFQVLRAFRSSYGLPPHAYKLCVRIGLAQRALRRGAALAEVAAEYGFVDQSHFTRHFKRLVGVTPLEYASARPRQRRARGAQAA